MAKLGASCHHHPSSMDSSPFPAPVFPDGPAEASFSQGSVILGKVSFTVSYSPLIAPSSVHLPRFYGLIRKSIFIKWEISGLFPFHLTLS